MYKKILVFVLIITISMSSFAAIVSDNDGGAFVTKSEFESLKSNFNMQVQQYETSIDEKIDGAIAAYLSGTKLEMEPTNILKKINNAVGGTLWFKNKFSNIGSNTNTTDLSINMTRHYTYKAYTNITLSGKYAYAWSNGTDRNERMFGINLQAGNPGAGQGQYVGSRLSYVETQGTSEYQYGIDYWTYSKFGSRNWTNWSAAFSYVTSGNSNITNSKNIITNGSGSGWVYERKPTGILVLKEYCTALYPRQEIEIVAHSYLNKVTTNKTPFLSYYCTAGGMGDNQVFSVLALPKTETWSTTESGTKIVSESTTAKAQYYKLNQYLIKSTDAIDYSTYMWGANDNTSIYYIDNTLLPTANSSTTTVDASETATTFQYVYFIPKGAFAANNNLSGQAFTYYPISISTTQGSAKQFANEYVSSIAGETVYIGGGIPIVETNEADQDLRIKLKFKKNGSSSTAYYKLSDMQFTNNQVSTGANLLASGSTTIGTEITLDINKSKKGFVWFTCYADTANDTDIAVDTMTVELR